MLAMIHPQDVWMLTKVGTLKTGDSFGEMALINSKPRSATVACIGECKFATMHKDDYKS